MGTNKWSQLHQATSRHLVLDLCDITCSPSSYSQVVSECFANKGVKAAPAAMPGRRAIPMAGKKGVAPAANVKKSTTPVVVPITSQKDCRACTGQHRKHTCGRDTTGLPAVSPAKNTNVKLPDWDAIIRNKSLRIKAHSRRKRQLGQGLRK